MVGGGKKKRGINVASLRKDHGMPPILRGSGAMLKCMVILRDLLLMVQ